MATPSVRTCPCRIKKPKKCRKCGPGVCTGKAEFDFSISYFTKSSSSSREWESFSANISGKWNGTVSFSSFNGNSKVTNIAYSIPNGLVRKCTYGRNFQTFYTPGPDDPLPCGTTVPGEEITITTQNIGCEGVGSCRNTGSTSYVEIIPYQYSEIYNFYYNVVINEDGTVDPTFSGAGIFWDFWETGGGPPGSPALNVTITNPYSPPLVTKWYVNVGYPGGWPIKRLNGSINITIPDEI